MDYEWNPVLNQPVLISMQQLLRMSCSRFLPSQLPTWSTRNKTLKQSHWSQQFTEFH